MDSFELNKIIGAILGTLLFVMGVGFIAEAVYHPRETGPGLTLPEPEATAAVVEEEAPPVPIGVLLASADIAAGENAARKCLGCHNFAEGSGNKTGPELYNAVERVIGSHPGFAYSAIFEEHRAAGDTWTYENLNEFLLAPKAFTPGTKMNFAGLRNDAERANVIAYMSSLSPSPVPFPPADLPEAAEPEEPVAVEAEAIDTPTTTSTETVVEGTPVTEIEPAAEAPATEAAPEAEATPEAEAAPAMDAPATEPAPAAGQ